MKRLMVHGCYDQDTLRTLSELGIDYFGFDLRGRSPNLIPFHQMQNCLKTFTTQKVHLIFENDKESTVLSFLNMLETSPVPLTLQFRDQKNLQYYESFQKPFFWMFDPSGDWENIFRSPLLKGVLLPLKFRSQYQDLPHLWDLIERRNLTIYLHAENFSQAEQIKQQPDIFISLDLSNEIEKSFRTVDQDLLRKKKLWRSLDESPSIQR